MILHGSLPEDMHAVRGLPGVQPVRGPWLLVDEAYAGQMALRRALLATRRDDVCAYTEAGRAAADELYALVLPMLPALGFDLESGARARCPDGAEVALDPGDPLGTLGALVQSDLCLMTREEGADEHHLSAAVLCFPAFWTLAEKIGRGMLRIHAPVTRYDADVARRVQRLFDGVQVGRPLWRYNHHFEPRPDLFTPMREAEKFGGPRAPRPPDAPFFRAERQTVLRLPQTRAVLFAIHTYMLARADVEDVLQAASEA